jgi:hypothetical protein
VILLLNPPTVLPGIVSNAPGSVSLEEFPLTGETSRFHSSKGVIGVRTLLPAELTKMMVGMQIT